MPGLNQNEPGMKVKGKCDFVIGLDVTGSMAHCIDGLIQKLELFIGALEKPVDVQGGQFSLKEWRGRFLPYRDLGCDGANAMFADLPFVTSAADLKKQLQDLPKQTGPDGKPTPAWGGGDEAESALDALYRAAKSPWREEKATRFIILFTDATTHPKLHPSTAGGGPDDVKEVVQELAKARAKLVLFGPKCSEYELLMSRQKEDLRQAWKLFPSREEAVGFFQDADRTPEFEKLLGVLGRTLTASSSKEL